MTKSFQKPIVDIPEFWDIRTSKMYDRNRYTDGLVEFFQKIGITTSSCILDAGCGTGFLLIDLIKRGYRVIGVDRSRNMIRQCKTNIERSGIYAKVFQLPWSELSSTSEAVFDLIYCRGNSLSVANSWGKTCIRLSQTKSLIQNALTNFYQALKPNGYLYTDTTKPDEEKRLTTLPFHWSSKKGGQVMYFKVQRTYDVDNKKRTTIVTVSQNDKSTVLRFPTYILTKKELCFMLKKACFRSIRGPIHIHGENIYDVFPAQKQRENRMIHPPQYSERNIGTLDLFSGS